jgi:hypothetical protein
MEEIVREILKESIKSDNSLHDIERPLAWYGNNKIITIEGHYSLDELEAIVWWVKHKKVINEE